MRQRFGSLFIGALFIYFAAPAEAKPANFQHFFPKWVAVLHDRLHGQCSVVYTHLMDDFSPICEAMNRQVPACRASRVIDCLTGSLEESWKANMASVAVLLGLLPTTLAILGSNSHELSLLALSRPMLALLLAMGAPGVYPIGASQHADHTDLLVDTKGRIAIPDLSPRSIVAISCQQYLLACASAANVAHVTWQLCVLTVNSFSPETSFFPALWVAIAVLVNFGAHLSLRLRVRIRNINGPVHQSKRHNGLRTWILRELTPCTEHDGSQIQLRQESWFFILMSWVTSVGAIASIIVGKLSLSAVLYMGTSDVAFVVARFFGSALLCRIVLNFELAVMRKTVKVSDVIVS